MKEYERRSGKVPKPFLEFEDLWECNASALAAFTDLSKTSTFTYQEINAYCELTGLNKIEIMVKVHLLIDAEKEYGNNVSKISSTD